MLKQLALAVPLSALLCSAVAVAQAPPPGVPPGPPSEIPPPVRAPEFSVGSAGVSIALLVGGALVIFEGRRRLKSRQSSSD